MAEPRQGMGDAEGNRSSLEESGIFGLNDAAADAAVVLMPVPFEATASYGSGAARGPQAILRASRQVELFDIETGHPHAQGIAMLPESSVLRQWNREARSAALSVRAATGGCNLAHARDRVDGLGRCVNERVQTTAELWLSRGKVFGVIGGDHSVSFGSIAAHVRVFPEMGILQVDAHADLRRAYEGFLWSHASIMDNVLERLPQVARLVQVGVRDLGYEEFGKIRDACGGRIVTHFDAVLAAERLRGTSWAAQCRRIVTDLPQEVYVSLDIDGLEPSLCPHTGTPVPGGLSFQELNLLLRVLVESRRRIVGFDLCEVAPGPGDDEWDGNVGARVLYKLIGWTLVSRGLSEIPALMDTC